MAINLRSIYRNTCTNMHSFMSFRFISYHILFVSYHIVYIYIHICIKIYSTINLSLEIGCFEAALHAIFLSPSSELFAKSSSKSRSLGIGSFQFRGISRVVETQKLEKKQTISDWIYPTCRMQSSAPKIFLPFFSLWNSYELSPLPLGPWVEG